MKLIILKKTALLIITVFIFSTTTILAQEKIDTSDQAAVSKVNADILLIDTLNPNLENTELALAEEADTQIEDSVENEPVFVEKIEDTEIYDALIRDRMACLESDIPLVLNDYVKGFIKFYAGKNPKHINRVLQRSARYFPIFESYLNKHSLPQELKYLSVVESALNPTAVSYAGAGGLWQFMPSTGRLFKLQQDRYFDERMNPEKSTEAACKYLNELYGMFNDWPTALAAYNCGPGRVRRTARKHDKEYFWDMQKHLPKQTQSYVPQFIAVTYVMNYADHYGIIPDSVEKLPETDTVLVNQYLNLERFAKFSEIPQEEIQDLNPEIKRNTLPEGTEGYPLLIPARYSESFALNRQAILDSAMIKGPEDIEYAAAKQSGSTYDRKKAYHKVRRGESLGRIAQQYGVRVSDLKRWNNIKGTLIRTNQRLAVWKNVTSYPKTNTGSAVATSKGAVHVVRSGDTLWSIAKRYEGLTVDKLKELNKLEDNNIKPGQKLVIG